MKKYLLPIFAALVLAWTSQASAALNGTPTTQPVSLATTVPVSLATTVPVSLATTIPVNCTSGCAAAATPTPATGTITANGQAVTLSMGSAPAVSYAITGTFVGTMQIKYSDDCSTYPATLQSTAAVVSFTAPATGLTGVSGHPCIELISTAWTSGTATVTLTPVLAQAVSMITGSAGQTAFVSSTADAVATTTIDLFTASQAEAYNGTSWDRVRKDTYAASPLWVSSGGASVTAIAANVAGPTVIKASAGRIASILITTAGTTDAVTFYNNASACSGTILAIAQPTATNAAAVAGYVVTPTNFVATTGITACGGAASPAVTVGYF